MRVDLSRLTVAPQRDLHVVRGGADERERLSRNPRGPAPTRKGRFEQHLAGGHAEVCPRPGSA